MSKGNPIVGLAHVVVSQQEMLEKANEQIEELKNDVRSRQDDMEDLNVIIEDRDREIGVLKDHIKEIEANAKCLSYALERSDKLNDVLSGKIQLYEQGKLLHWQKFVPDEGGGMCLPLRHRHVSPHVDGLYRYTEEHTINFYDELQDKSIPVKNCYGIGCVAVDINRGNLYVRPNGEKGAELIGISVRYIDDYIIMDEMPEELK